MRKKSTEYNQIIKALTYLHKEFPNCSFTNHLFLILEEYKYTSSLWSMTDKEFLFALEKHQTTTLLQHPVTPRTHWQELPTDEEIDQILRDGKNLDKLFQEEEEEEDGY